MEMCHLRAIQKPYIEFSVEGFANSVRRSTCRNKNWQLSLG
jgi:hypothetical protein